MNEDITTYVQSRIDRQTERCQVSIIINIEGEQYVQEIGCWSNVEHGEHEAQKIAETMGCAYVACFEE
ncbi:hypothetical protein SD70_26020 [Gordoniibacillus kamchatkensis]|uniref:Uncharacterized protein n=1 Tax=Gordoniibacillus kamchatkensis TaxID=1590651 RepID=A0ABR5AC03_9BACL|nr:hypothetical protein [Paenibacillus sp. VKM B-2647]KIL38496.1 hypothetical protein SD70_26020 [Paenibacillus sp. VKM B-2647]